MSHRWTPRSGAAARAQAAHRLPALHCTDCGRTYRDPDRHNCTPLHPDYDPDDCGCADPYNHRSDTCSQLGALTPRWKWMA